MTGLVKIATVTASNGFDDDGAITCAFIVDGRC